MKLKEYLKKYNISKYRFAQNIGLSVHSSINNYVIGKRYPRTDIMQRIVDATKGEVTPNDFLNIPNKNINRILTHSKDNESFEEFCNNYTLYELYEKNKRKYPYKTLGFLIDVDASTIYKKVNPDIKYNKYKPTTKERETLYNFYYDKFIQNK